MEDPDRFYRFFPSPGGRRQSLLPLPWWEGLGEGVRRWDLGHALPPPPDLPHQGGGRILEVRTTANLVPPLRRLPEATRSAGGASRVTRNATIHRCLKYWNGRSFVQLRLPWPWCLRTCSESGQCPSCARRPPKFSPPQTQRHRPPRRCRSCT